MKRLLPGRVELAIFGGAAVVGAGVVSMTGAPDIGMSLTAIPIFIAATIMGMRRSGQWSAINDMTNKASNLTKADE